MIFNPQSFPATRGGCVCGGGVNKVKYSNARHFSEAPQGAPECSLGGELLDRRLSMMPQSATILCAHRHFCSRPGDMGQCEMTCGPPPRAQSPGSLSLLGHGSLLEASFPHRAALCSHIGASCSTSGSFLPAAPQSLPPSPMFCAPKLPTA